MFSNLFGKKRKELLREVENSVALARRAGDIALNLNRQVKALKEEGKNIRYVQVEFKNEGSPEKNYMDGDSQYLEWVSGLLDDSRFQWLIYKRQMGLIDVMRAIPTNDPTSAEMRLRAAYRMDGIQMLLDDMVALKRAYKMQQMPKEEVL